MSRLSFSWIPQWGKPRSYPNEIDLMPYLHFEVNDVTCIRHVAAWAKGCHVCGQLIPEGEPTFYGGCASHFWAEYSTDGAYQLEVIQLSGDRRVPRAQSRRQKRVDMIFAGIIGGVVYGLLGGYLARIVWAVLERFGR